MSTYERYDSARATVYDKSRPPIGAEIVAGCLATLDKPLAEVQLLDAGCGTGQYTAALARMIGRVVAVDLSRDMLRVACTNLGEAGASGRAILYQGAIEALPFADRTFDAVMFNQVLHHLEDGTDPTYSGHRRALAEAHRVLRPGGVLVVNACSHEQLYEGFWYYNLIPAAQRQALRRCAPAPTLEAMLQALGFAFKGRIVPLDAVMQGDAHFDHAGPFDPEWRHTDSIWALASAEEIAAAQARLRELEDRKVLDDYMRHWDARRRRCGHFTFFFAVRDDVS